MVLCLLGEVVKPSISSPNMEATDTLTLGEYNLTSFCAQLVQVTIDNKTLSRLKLLLA